jgi:hypothetical protein
MAFDTLAFLRAGLAELVGGDMNLEFHGGAVIARRLPDNISFDRDGDFVLVILDEFTELRASALHVQDRKSAGCFHTRS